MEDNNREEPDNFMLAGGPGYLEDRERDFRLPDVRGFRVLPPPRNLSERRYLASVGYYHPHHVALAQKKGPTFFVNSWLESDRHICVTVELKNYMWYFFCHQRNATKDFERLVVYEYVNARDHPNGDLTVGIYAVQFTTFLQTRIRFVYFLPRNQLVEDFKKLLKPQEVSRRLTAALGGSDSFSLMIDLETTFVQRNPKDNLPENPAEPEPEFESEGEDEEYSDVSEDSAIFSADEIELGEGDGEDGMND